jgi:hypothetical protein
MSLDLLTSKYLTPIVTETRSISIRKMAPVAESPFLWLRLSVGGQKDGKARPLAILPAKPRLIQFTIPRGAF